MTLLCQDPHTLAPGIGPLALGVLALGIGPHQHAPRVVPPHALAPGIGPLALGPLAPRVGPHPLTPRVGPHPLALGIGPLAPEIDPHTLAPSPGLGLLGPILRKQQVLHGRQDGPAPARESRSRSKQWPEPWVRAGSLSVLDSYNREHSQAPIVLCLRLRLRGFK